MSAGHRHNHIHRADLMNELEHLLGDDRVKTYLLRGYRVDASMKVPLTGGSNNDGTVYYLDRDLPIDLRPFVLWHERVEKALRAVLGFHYGRAHELATTAERMLVEAKGRDWDLYKKTIGRYVRENERPAKLPPDFDRGPYEESGMSHLIEAA